MVPLMSKDKSAPRIHLTNYWEPTLRPLPMPVTIRATIMCEYVNAVAWRIAPMIMIIPPMTMVFLRPSLSPSQRFDSAPTRQPIS